MTFGPFEPLTLRFHSYLDLAYYPKSFSFYVAQVFRTRERRERGYEYRIRLEVSPKFAGNDRLGTPIIYIKKYTKKIIKKNMRREEI